MLIQIYASNYDSQDDFVNGANRIIKAYTKTNKIYVIPIKFFEANITKVESWLTYRVMAFVKIGSLYYEQKNQ